MNTILENLHKSKNRRVRIIESSYTPEEELLIKAFDEYVPSQGNADSIIGEVTRLINRIIYRFNNDGDIAGDDNHELNPASEAVIELFHICKQVNKGALSKIAMFLDRNIIDAFPMNESKYSNLLVQLSRYFVEVYDNAELFKGPVPSRAYRLAQEDIEDRNSELRYNDEESEEDEDWY